MGSDGEGLWWICNGAGCGGFIGWVGDRVGTLSMLARAGVVEFN